MAWVGSTCYWSHPLCLFRLSEVSTFSPIEPHHLLSVPGFENKTFVEYLKHKKLDDQLIHYILYAIAMGGDSTPCLEGVASCQRFLQSLGRYGNTPFICPLYGSGELPQCFCRYEDFSHI